MPEPEKQQFNIYLSAGLVRRIKHAAVDEGESLSALVERVLEGYLQAVYPQVSEQQKREGRK